MFMVNPIHLYMGVQVKSRPLCIGMWLALAWLSCCLHYGPSSSFCHLGWTVLLLSQEKNLFTSLCLKIMYAWNCMTWNCVSQGVSTYDTVNCCTGCVWFCNTKFFNIYNYCMGIWCYSRWQSFQNWNFYVNGGIPCVLKNAVNSFDCTLT